MLIPIWIIAISEATHVFLSIKSLLESKHNTRILDDMQKQYKQFAEKQKASK